MPNPGGDLSSFTNTGLNEDISEKTEKFIEDATNELTTTENNSVPVEKSVTDMLESEKNESKEPNEEIVNEKVEEKQEEEKPEWQDLLGSGAIMKKITSEGTPITRPIRGEKCTISYVCKLENDTIVETVEKLQINLGECDVIQGLDVSIGLMSINERCTLKIQPRLAYGEKGCPPNVLPNTNLIYDLHLISVDPEDEIEELSVMERKKIGNKKRERGNWWYQRGDNNLAIQCYRRALDYLDEVEGGVTGPLAEGGEKPEVTDADLQSLLEDRISVCNNMAAAQIKLELYDQALASLQTVLRCQPENVKALYRKAKIYVAKNDLWNALKCLEKARDIQPGDAIIQKEIGHVKGLIEKQKLSEREYARRMFGSPKESRSNTEQKQEKRSKLGIWATLGVSAAVGLAGVVAYKFKYA